ncbi:MAG: hypothetical protein GXO33_04335 [Epsilonproteobacteria bacterium]|jgi:hypothetical protein|nr:hypothetical protein [Campylobacterota bacterium]
MRRGFGIIQALLIIVMVGGLLTVVIRYARAGVRYTVDGYVREQAELMTDSAVEWALFEIEKKDGKCWAGGEAPPLADGRGKRYTARVTVEKYYLYDGDCSGVPVERITTPESQYYVMLRVEVNATVDGRQRVRLVRRTLQRL